VQLYFLSKTRFGEIAKQTPPQARIQQQTNVIIPQSRQDLFRNKRSATQSIANRLKKVKKKKKKNLLFKFPHFRHL